MTFLFFISKGATEEIDDSATASEIIWNFSRYPENTPGRLALKQNPHFYLELSDDPASYGSKFHKVPLRDFAYLQRDTIYVLLDKSCRLFLDVAKPHTPRIFSNLWKPHRKVILKGEYSPRRVVCSLTYVHLRCRRQLGLRGYGLPRHWGESRLLVSSLYH